MKNERVAAKGARKRNAVSRYGVTSIATTLFTLLQNCLHAGTRCKPIKRNLDIAVNQLHVEIVAKSRWSRSALSTRFVPFIKCLYETSHRKKSLFELTHDVDELP